MGGIHQGRAPSPRSLGDRGGHYGATAAVTAQLISETTPESTDSVYMSDFRRYLIQREKHIDKVGMATAEITLSLDTSVRRRYADNKYISASDVLWQDIARDCNRVAKIDANVGLYKLNAIRRVDFDSATAYHSRILEIATELRNTGTELPESVLAFYMIQGLPTGDVWLACRTSLTSGRSAGRCQDILDHLQVFERSYAWDRHDVSAYTNPQTSTALFAKKGTGASKKKESKAAGAGASADTGSGKASSSGGDKAIKCFGCGKKGHKKFECRSKHLWKETDAENDAKDSKDKAASASKANVVKVEPEPTATHDRMAFLLLMRSAGPTPKEKPMPQPVEKPMRPAIRQAGFDHMSLLLDEAEDEQMALLPRRNDVQVDEIRESVAVDRCDDTTVWVVDSGATSHCTGMNSHKLVQYQELAPGEHEVVFSDESRVNAAGIGDIAMLLPRGDGSSTRVILRNVLYVPDCGKNNLMIVYQFLTVGIKVDYDLDPKCGVTLYTKKDRKTIACGTVRGKSFYMIADNRLQITDRAWKAHDIVIWHNRLGHLSLRAIKKLYTTAT
jgi:hypothetical protein